MFNPCIYVQAAAEPDMEEDVREMADWTTQADERILEFLHRAGAHPSSAIHHLLNDISDGIEYSRPHISRRCNELADYGLLRKDYTHYELTDLGEQYIRGDLDASSLTKDVDTVNHVGSE